MRQRLQALAAEMGLPVTVHTYTCFGRCGEGPNLFVFPEIVWRRAVSPDDAAPVLAWACAERLTEDEHARRLEPERLREAWARLLDEAEP
ncbi:MAG TPA: hypothetical protein VIN09_14515 [Chloroflexota bacterium]